MKSTTALALASALVLLLSCLAARGESVRVSDREPGAASPAVKASPAVNQADTDFRDTCETRPATIADAIAACSSDAEDPVGGILPALDGDPFAADVKLLTRHIAASLLSPAATSIGALPPAGAVELVRMSLVNSETGRTNANSIAKHRARAPAVRGVYAESLR